MGSKDEYSFFDFTKRGDITTRFCKYEADSMLEIDDDYEEGWDPGDQLSHLGSGDKKEDRVDGSACRSQRKICERQVLP